MGESEFFIGPYPARTDDLLLVREALWPTELTARKRWGKPHPTMTLSAVIGGIKKQVLRAGGLTISSRYRGRGRKHLPPGGCSRGRH